MADVRAIAKKVTNKVLGHKSISSFGSGAYSTLQLLKYSSSFAFEFLSSSITNCSFSSENRNVGIETLNAAIIFSCRDNGIPTQLTSGVDSSCS